MYEAGIEIANRYRIADRLAQGAMGLIYRAHHIFTGQEVALKVLLDCYLDRADIRTRFEREARALCDMRHPNIVEYYDHGTDRFGRPFLVMEYLDGYSGLELLRRYQTMNPEKAVHVLGQLCSALAIAHSRGVVHRDLKWNNVVVTPTAADELYVKLIDFGILKYAHGTPQNDGRRITATGVLLGTPEYSSPEQILGEPLDGRSDVYSLGVMAFELLTGTRPFEADSKADLLLMHIKQPPMTFVEAGRADLPPSMVSAVMRSLAKKPEDRFSSVAYLRRALEASIKAPDEPMPVPSSLGVGSTRTENSGMFSWLRKLSGKEGS